ncbi:MAG: chemotaxis protein CheW [Massilia sp.]
MAADDAAADRRNRLRQYQAQLLERVQAARTGGTPRVHQLGVAIGAGRYLLDLVEAGEIAPLGALTPVPLTRPWYLGLANVRGNLVGVIDLARYAGGEAAATAPGATAAARLVTFAPSLGFNCALLVSRVYGLREAAGMTPAGERLRDPEANEWTRLSLAALVRDERFAHIGL